MKKLKNNTKDFLWNAIGLTLNAFNSLFFLIVVRFINGLDTAGVFTYAFAICIFFYAFAIFFNRSFQVSDAKDRFSFNDYFTCRITTSVIGLVAVILFSLINGFGAFEFSIVLFLCLFRTIEAISDCFYGAIQKRGKLYQTGISLSLKAILGLAAFALVDYLTGDLLFAIIALILVNVAFFFFYDLKNYFKLYKTKPKLSPIRLSNILKASLPVAIFSILAIYLSNCQKYILPYFAPDDIQAIFGILIMPATVLALVGSYLINPFISTFTDHHTAKRYQQFITSTKKLFFAMLALGAVALIVCYFIGIPILEVIFQLDLSAYHFAFLLIILASVFYAITMIFSSLLTILGENRRQTYAYFISAIVATVVALVLIPTSFIDGAVYSFLISSFVLIAIYSGLLQYKLHTCKKLKEA